MVPVIASLRKVTDIFVSHYSCYRSFKTSFLLIISLKLQELLYLMFNFILNILIEYILYHKQFKKYLDNYISV